MMHVFKIRIDEHTNVDWGCLLQDIDQLKEGSYKDTVSVFVKGLKYPIQVVGDIQNIALLINSLVYMKEVRHNHILSEDFKKCSCDKK